MQTQQNPTPESVTHFLNTFLNNSKTIEASKYGNKVIQLTESSGYVGIASKLTAILNAIACIGYASGTMQKQDLETMLPALTDIAKDLICWSEAEFLDNITGANQ